MIKDFLIDKYKMKKQKILLLKTQFEIVYAIGFSKRKKLISEKTERYIHMYCTIP